MTQKRNGLGAMLIAMVCSAAPAVAEIVIPSLTYRTGPYGGSGVPYSDGFTDYLTLLNERDGGINGQPIEVVECEYGYNTERGLACFEETYEKGALLYHPMSTGLTYQLVPKVHELGVTLHTMGYGLTAAADGEMFPYAFNFPAHYWHAATAQIRHIKETEGSLEGMKIVHMYHNSGYGKEPIPTLEALSEVEGFDLQLVPVDHPGEDQTAVWEEIKAADADYILLWGWGIMNQVALQSAVEIDFPLDHVIGIWWSANEGDIKPLGAQGEGYKAVNFHAAGTSFRIYNELNMLVYQTNKARGELNNVGEVLYNRGIMAAIFATEAIRKGMEIHGTNEVTRDMVRDGYEALNMNAEKFTELGMDGFLPEVSISCENHAGAGLVSVNQWDSTIRRWEQITEYYEPDSAVIDPQVVDASIAFAETAGMTRKGC